MTLKSQEIGATTIIEHRQNVLYRPVGAGFLLVNDGTLLFNVVDDFIKYSLTGRSSRTCDDFS